jgi:nitroreductase
VAGADAAREASQPVSGRAASQVPNTAARARAGSASSPAEVKRRSAANRRRRSSPIAEWSARVALRRRPQWVAVAVEAAGRQVVQRGLQLAGRAGVGGDGGPRSRELVAIWVQPARAGDQPVAIQAHVGDHARLLVGHPADGVGAVGALVGGEAHVAVGAEDLGVGAVRAASLRDEPLERLADRALVDSATRVEVGLRVVGLKPGEEGGKVGAEAGEWVVVGGHRSAGILSHPSRRSVAWARRRRVASRPPSGRSTRCSAVLGGGDVIRGHPDREGLRRRQVVFSSSAASALSLTVVPCSTAVGLSLACAA